MPDTVKIQEIIDELITISQAAKADKNGKVPGKPYTGRFMEQTFTELLAYAALCSKDLDEVPGGATKIQIEQTRKEYFHGSGAANEVLKHFGMDNDKYYADAIGIKWLSALNPTKLEDPVTRSLLNGFSETNFLDGRPQAQTYMGGSCPRSLTLLMALARAIDE